MDYDIVEGWTAPIKILLETKGVTPTGTMAGMSVTFELADRDGNLVNFSGDLSISNAATWELTLTPDAADFVPGYFRGRVKATDSGGRDAYFPSGLWDNWTVRPVT